MSLFTILSSYINLGSNLKTEFHIPVVVIQSCIWHSVLILVKCSKPTAHTKNNLQSIMLDYQTLWHCPNLKREAIPRHAYASPKNLFCLSALSAMAWTFPIYTFQLGALLFLVTCIKQSKVKKLQTWSCMIAIMWAVAQDLATQAHTVCKIILHNSPPKFLTASTAGLLSKRPHIPPISYWYIKQLTELQTLTSYTEMQTRDSSGTTKVYRCNCIQVHPSPSILKP